MKKILPDLSNELLLLVADRLESDADIYAFARTTTTLSKLLIPYRYRVDAKRPLSKALFWAATRRGDSACQKALQAGANPMTTNKWGQTPLHLATQFGHEVARLLLAMPDVNPNCEDLRGQTPLMQVAMQGNVRILKLLLAQDDINP